MEEYLHKLDELVNVEKKIITYKWLSRSFQFNVNYAKKVLLSFVEQERAKENCPLFVTYYVAGMRRKADREMVQCIAVVNEDQLPAAKKSLEEVTGVHVYSVQRSKLMDGNALYTADYDLQKESMAESSRWSCIKCQSAVPRSEQPATLVVSRETATVASSTAPSQSTGMSAGENSHSRHALPAPAKAAFPAKGDNPLQAAFGKCKGALSKSKPTGVEAFFGQGKKEVKVKEDQAGEKPAVSEKIGKAGDVATKESADSKKEKLTSKSFFGEQLPKKIKTEEANVKPETDKTTVKANRSSSTRSSVDSKTDSSGTKANSQSSSVGLDMSSDLFDAECDSEEEQLVTKKGKGKEKQKQTKTTSKSSVEALEDIFDAECTSDEDIEEGKASTTSSKSALKKTKAPLRSKKRKSAQENEKAVSTEPATKRTRLHKDFLEEDDEPATTATTLSSAKTEERSNTAPPTDDKVSSPPQRRRKRVKKLVSKTYIENDQFVTEKVYESDSTDASDEDMSITKPFAGAGNSGVLKFAESKTNRGASKKTVGPTKTAGKSKQSSLMNFFKK